MKIFLVELEPVETRYTAQWKKFLPEQLCSTGFDVEIIAGPDDAPQDTTPGAFLNFSGTNYWKSEQLKTISKMFAEGKVKDGDYFLYTDAWNPTVLQLKYMAELLGVKIKIGGMWHAGSYDPADFLGRLIGKAPWVRHAEMSMYECFDDNFYATDFHIDMFTNTFWNDDRDIDRQLLHKIRRVGWPMEYLEHSLDAYKNLEKKNLILFPHRLAPEKQVEIFEDLAKHLPQYDFVICQNKKLTKHEYHTLLGQSKMVFSANLQETLGISWYEGVLVDAIPLIPDRLSYSEMAVDSFKYPAHWTSNYESYLENRENIINKIIQLMDNYDSLKNDLTTQREKLSNDFFSGNALYEVLRSRQHGK
jgi:hypothetical protein